MTGGCRPRAGTPATTGSGTVPFAELPYTYNPASGVLVAANQPVIGSQYPRTIGSAFSYGWRSQEILDGLREAPTLTMDSAEQFFYDDTIRVATDLVPSLLRVKVTDPWVFEGQQTLVGWDYSADAGSASAAYFNVVMHNILKLTFRDELPADLWPTGGDRWYAVVVGLLDQPRNRWWDDASTPDTVETRDDILLAAMTQARREITSLMARDVDEWRWGRLHTVTLRNQTMGNSGIKPIEALFNRGAYEVDGGSAVVNAMGYDDKARLHRGQRADHADAGRSRRSRPVALGQPERGVGSRLPPQLRRPDRVVGRQPDVAVRVQPRGGGRPHHDPARTGARRLIRPRPNRVESAGRQR